MVVLSLSLSLRFGFIAIRDYLSELYVGVEQKHRLFSAAQRSEKGDFCRDVIPPGLRAVAGRQQLTFVRTRFFLFWWG